MTKANLKICEEQKSAFFSMKKFLFMFIVFLFVLAYKDSAFSQSTITVVGRGTTKEEALQDALRSAVEKATGVFLYSVTDVQNFKVVQDKIVTQSKGYVKDYQIVEEKSFDGLIVLTVTVTVDVESIKTILRDDLKAVTYDDVLKDYMLVTQKMARLQKSAELLKVITSRPLEEMYTIDYAGYEIGDVGLSNVKGNLLVKIIPNLFYWNTYEKILEQVSEEGQKAHTCGYWRLSKTVTLNLNPADKGIVANTYYVHSDLSQYLVNSVRVNLKLCLQNEPSCFEAKIQLYKNFLHASDIQKTEHGFSGGTSWHAGRCDATIWTDKSDKNIMTYNMPFASGIPFIPNTGIAITVPFTINDPDLIKTFNKIKLKISSQ